MDLAPWPHRANRDLSRVGSGHALIRGSSLRVRDSCEAEEGSEAPCAVTYVVPKAK